jgi:hypothetical protein
MTFMPNSTTKKDREPIKIIRGTKSIINEKESKDKESNNNAGMEDLEIETLGLHLKAVYINLEPYIEDYLLDNYFKLYKLQSFQMKGTSHLTPSLISPQFLNIDTRLDAQFF